MPPIYPIADMPSVRDYVAPTVYKRAGQGVSGWNYYGTLNEAIVKWKYLNNQPGGANIQPEGAVVLGLTTEAQTLGINVDFYQQVSGGWQYVSYKNLRSLASLPPIVYRFYTTAGAGPYFAIFDPKLFGMSATTLESVTPDKLQALDAFYREVNLLKYRYNELAGFLNSLSQKQLTPREQQIFNEGSLRYQNMQAQLLTLKGVEFHFSDKGAVIGIVPFLIIAIVIILAAATAWTVTSILEMQEKTKQINDSYDLTKWIASKKQELAQQVTSGAITQQQANEINANLDKASAVANKVADNASRSNDGIISQITGLVKWSLVAMLAFYGIKNFSSPKTTTNASS